MRARARAAVEGGTPRMEGSDQWEDALGVVGRQHVEHPRVVQRGNAMATANLLLVDGTESHAEITRPRVDAQERHSGMLVVQAASPRHALTCRLPFCVARVVVRVAPPVVPSQPVRNQDGRAADERADLDEETDAPAEEGPRLLEDVLVDLRPFVREVRLPPVRVRVADDDSPRASASVAAE